MRRKIYGCICGLLCLCIAGCGTDTMKQSDSNIEKADSSGDIVEEFDTENVLQDEINDVTESETEGEKILETPSRESVLAMREVVLAGMSEGEITRLTENIKVANLQMESAYFNDNLFKKLEDENNAYWLYFDQEGDIQLGWWYNGAICSKENIMKLEKISEEEFYDIYNEPAIVYNRFDAENFAVLIEDMKSTVHDENLQADLQHLIDLTYLAAETHDVQYVIEIYEILHDMDYFLLRYGIDDVGQFTTDDSFLKKYYGVLNVYNAE